MSNTRQIVDFSINDQGKEARDALYAEIHDRVMAKFEEMKTGIAQNLIVPHMESVEHDDEAEDKKMVKKAVGQHESALHEGEPKTTLKLKSGGRTKKEVGTVKKYCGGKSVKKYDTGGIVDTVKSIGKRLYENVMGTPEQNAAAQARLDKYEASKKAGAPSAPVAKKRGGKC